MNVQWGAWTEIGMAAGSQGSGYIAGGVTNCIGSWAINATLAFAACFGEVVVADVLWSKFLNLYGSVPDYLSAFSSHVHTDAVTSQHNDVVTSLQSLEPTPRLLTIESIILLKIHQSTGHTLTLHDSLGDSDIDSLSSIELRDALLREFGKAVTLPSALIFDFSNAAQLASFVSEEITSVSGTEVATPIALKQQIGALGVVGVACLLADEIISPTNFWKSLDSHMTHISSKGPTRWAQACADAPKAVLAGAFMHTLEPTHVPSGTEQLDPHVRLLLDVSHAALEDAHVMQERQKMAVVTAAQTSDFVQAMPTYVVARAVASGLRINGPYMNVEAVCSSGYLALHHAMQLIQRGDCDCGVVSGISLMLRPEWSIETLLNGILSRSGQMRPLDAGECM